MLRWMCVVAKMDKITNERIRGSTKVKEMSQGRARKKDQLVRTIPPVSNGHGHR